MPCSWRTSTIPEFSRRWQIGLRRENIHLNRMINVTGTALQAG